MAIVNGLAFIKSQFSKSVVNGEVITKKSTKRVNHRRISILSKNKSRISQAVSGKGGLGGNLLFREGFPPTYPVPST
jgi:hypothetical protein